MSITASEARKSLLPLIRKVNEDHEAIEIVSKHGNAVLMSAEDYAALREGAYLLRSPANARRLLASIDRLEHGNRSWPPAWFGAGKGRTTDVAGRSLTDGFGRPA